MLIKKSFNDCCAELDMDSTCCLLKVLRTEDTAKGFADYKQAIISASKRLIEVIEKEERTHSSHIQDF